MIQSVNKAMMLLLAISDGANQPVPLTELAEKVGLNKSTCVHILQTMCESGIIDHVSRTEGYRLGPMAYYFTRFGRYEQALVKVSAPLMQWLNQKTGHTIVLNVLRNDRKVLLHWVEGVNKLPKRGNIAFETVYDYSTGHAMLAYMTPAQRKAFVDAHGMPKKSSWPQAYEESGLEGACQAIRKKGYLFYRRDYIQGVDCAWNPVPSAKMVGIAAAILRKGRMVGALGIALPEETSENRMTEEEERGLARYLTTATKEIGRRLSEDETDPS